MTTLLIAATVFVLIGAALYNVDYAFGTGFYRRYYNVTHGNQLPENETKGFIYRQSSRMRLAVAFAIVVVFAILGSLVAPLSFAGLFWSIVAIPFLTAGFYLGPFAYERWQRKNTVLDYLDRVESGEADPLSDLGKRASKIGARIGQEATKFAARSAQKEETITPSSPVAASSSSTDDSGSGESAPKEDPQETIRRFTGHR